MIEDVRLSFDWLSGCSGCEISFADLHERLLHVFRDIKLVRIPFLMDTKEYVPADIGIITGSIRTRNDIEAAHRMRESCTTIIALGTCPVYGGPHGGSYAHTTQQLLAGAYVRNPSTRTHEVPDQVPELLDEDRTLDSEIDVDVYLPGCPPHPAFIVEALQVLLGQRHHPIEQHNVCYNCTRRMERSGVTTLRRSHEGSFDPDVCFLSQGCLCFGSVTLDRCFAPCPRAGAPCFSCAGPSLTVILEPQKDVRTLVATRMARMTRIPEQTILREVERRAKTHYTYAMASPVFRRKPTFMLRRWISLRTEQR